MTAATIDSTAEQKNRKPYIGEFGWIWVATAILFAISAWVAPGTVRFGALSAMLPFAAMLAIVAVGHTLVIQQRGIDMSSSAIFVLGGLIAAWVGAFTGSAFVGVLASLMVAMLAGFFNGLLVVRLNIVPIVATMSSAAIFVGVIFSISDGRPMSVPPAMDAFAHFRLFGISGMLWLSLVFITIVASITKMTVIGRRFVAVGVSPRAASAAGIRLTHYQIGTYVAAALCFAVAGMLNAGFLGTASFKSGADYLLPGVAAVVVGGTPFTGGRGSVIASGVAAVFMAQLGQMVLALGADGSVQLFVQAAALVIAVAIRNIGTR